MPPGQTPLVWQAEADEALLAGARRGMRSMLVSSATGTGKGTLLAGLFARAMRKGSRPVVVTHTDELVSDILKRVRRLDHDPGLVKAQAKDWTRSGVVASRQTLLNCMDSLVAYAPRVVFYDEAHIALDAQIALRRVVPNATWIGVTATPFRSAPKGETEGLGDVYEGVVYEHPITKAIAVGDLCRVEARRLQLDVDLTGCDLADDASVSERLNVREVNDVIAADYHAHHAGTPAIYFCADIAHAKGLAAAMGPRAEWISGDDPERESKLARHRAGEFDVLCNRDLLVFGYDDSRIAVVGMAAPTQSLVRYLQMIGRGTRKGKPKCTVVDCVGSTETLRVVTFADLAKAEKKAEKKALKAKDAEAKERTLTVGADILGQRTYEVFLFGDEATRRLGVAWYAHQRSYTCAGEGGRLGLVERNGPEWEAFVVTRDPNPPPRVPWVKGETRTVIDPGDVIESCGRHATLDLAAAAVVRSLGTPKVLPEDWSQRPATQRMMDGLRRWGMRKVEGLTMAESHSMLDAILVTRKVREWQRRVSG